MTRSGGERMARPGIPIEPGTCCYDPADGGSRSHAPNAGEDPWI
jgi:hypothetical protein